MITFLYFDLDRHGERVYRHNKKIYQEQLLSMICDDGNYYLLCYTEDVDCDTNINTFRLDRMADVNVSDEPITDTAVKTIKSIKGYPKQVFKMYGGVKRMVRLEFDESLIGVIFNKFGEDTLITEVNGRYTATVQVQLSPTFWGWLTQFPGQMRIISPDEAREQYIEFLQSAITQYIDQSERAHIVDELINLAGMFANIENDKS